MGKKVKEGSLLICLLIISLLHLSFSIARPGVAKALYYPAAVQNAIDSTDVTRPVKSIYDSLQLDLAGLSRQAFDFALDGWEKLNKEGKLANQAVIAIVDFSQPSTSKRLYVLDMKNYSLLFNTLVAHGRNSGKQRAVHFSNKFSSYKSSPGFYITGNVYNGSNGYSLRLDGIENGINDKALKRGIVIHGANYVHESFSARQGYIGRSQGCRAVPLKDAKNIIDTIKHGACLYIYTPDPRYLSRSEIVKGNLHS
ncbi:MAG TPA: murein L,D-transpeptidase catalytic domain family protein [Chitinophagaceae bacterium]|nr:murein L,D-transpeptidase catalytic domain family protein [Chitinophagaceae bacterium]